jgi:CHAD domain-containing protein
MKVTRGKQSGRIQRPGATSETTREPDRAALRRTIPAVAETARSLHSETTGKSSGRIAPAPPGRPPQPVPSLDPAMPCDTAFRVIAGHYLSGLSANHEATCNGHPDALHQMRVALTHLRTAILFFSPMVADDERPKIRDELKWLNARLGAVRDIDVAIERLTKANQARCEAIPDHQSWNAKAADAHQHLARVLRSVRYRRLVKNTSDWIEHGRWSIESGKPAKQRLVPVIDYSAGKLARWQRKLLKKSRKLKKMGSKKRHRLRLLNKKLTYSTDFFVDLFSEKKFSGPQASLKYLRKAQRSLGQLNDDANARSLTVELKADGAHAPLHFLKPKRKKRLLRKAAAAYRKLAKVNK